MIKIENINTWGFEGAIRGMRNPLNSWDMSDSDFSNGNIAIGMNDLDLMKRLFRAGSEHRKYMRMIHVQMDVTAPLYWWKEFDTYKVGTVANSCSTMHKIADKEFELSDFSHEHLGNSELEVMDTLISVLNANRAIYAATGEKWNWWQMIQLLPSSYNQKRTVDFNYETAVNIMHQRSGHKLDEWRQFCNALLMLPWFAEVVNNG